MESSEGVWAYFAVFGALVAAGLGFPIPEELPVIAGGALAAHASTQVPREHPYWFILWPVCILGVVIADGLLYTIGRLGGRRLLTHPWMERWFLSPEKREKTEENVHKYGIWILLGARFLPGIRAGVFVIAGSLKMPLVRFIISDGLYAIPGVSLLFFLSFWFTDRFKDLFDRMHNRFESVVSLLVVIGIAAASGFYAYAYMRRRVETGDPKEVPILSAVIKASGDDVPEDGEHTIEEKGPRSVAGGTSVPRIKLNVPQHIIDGITQHAHHESPNECCGLLAGKLNGYVTRCLPLVNSEESPVKFESTEQSMLQARRNIRDMGLQLLAVYHSHPTGDANPSRSDIEKNYAPDVATVIISLASEPPQIGFWYLDTDPPTPAEFTIQ